MKWRYDDGGRKAAGYSGTTGDCVTRAIAIAVDRPYQEVYARIAAYGRQERPSKSRTGRSHPRTGVFNLTTRKVIASYGWRWVPVMAIGKGCTMHLLDGEVPTHPRMILRLSRHVTAVVNGVIHDIFNPSREGTRCIYGYWLPPTSATKTLTTK